MYWLNYLNLQNSMLISILSGFSIMFMLFGVFLFGLSFFETNKRLINSNKIYGFVFFIIGVLIIVLFKL